MYLKIALFSQLFFLFFKFSSSNTKHDQQFIVEYLTKKDDKPYINFLKINLNNQNINKKTLEIYLEISEEMENKTIFVQPFNKLNSIGKNKMYDTNNVIFINGKRQMKIEEKFLKKYLKGVIIFEYSISTYGYKQKEVKL